MGLWRDAIISNLLHGKETNFINIQQFLNEIFGVHVFVRGLENSPCKVS